MDTLSEAIGHALESVFVVKTQIPIEEKAQLSPTEHPSPYIKKDSEITVHAVIIYDWGVYAHVMYSMGSLSDQVNCGNCENSSDLGCTDTMDCWNTSAEIPLDMLATHCDLWEPEILEVFGSHIH